MIDTHTHLYDEAFAEDYAGALDRASKAGVEHLVFPGIDSSVHERMTEAAARSGGRASVATGLHPTHIRKRGLEAGTGLRGEQTG